LGGKTLYMKTAQDRGIHTEVELGKIIAVFRAEFPLNKNLAHIKMLYIFGDDNIRPEAGSEPSPIGKAETFSGVQSGHAQRRHGRDPLFHAYPEVVIDVTMLKNTAGLIVVRAKNAAAAVFRGEGGNKVPEVMTG